MIHTWNYRHWHRLTGQLGRLPHALLFAGPQGGGKADFALALAARVLCEKAQGQEEACGHCASCNWLAGGNHPDFRLIEPGGDESDGSEAEVETAAPKKKSEQIRISQIRGLDDFLNVGTHRHGARIILIQPAEAMNHATANSLLKMLEEPSASTLFILITNNSRRLLPTLLSRCQVLKFPRPDSQQALAWLRQSVPNDADAQLSHAGGMPLAAARGAADWQRLEGFLSDLSSIEALGPVAIAGRWEAWLKESKDGQALVDKPTLVIWLQKWVFDLALAKLGNQPIFHAHKLQAVRQTAARASLSALFDCYNDLLRIRAVSQHPLNPRLFLEDMLARYARTVMRGR
jgi:DNA polymerase-3 subunit delta'